MADDMDYVERVCRGGVGEDFLFGLINQHGFVAESAFWGAKRKATDTAEELADHVEGVFKLQFERRLKARGRP